MDQQVSTDFLLMVIGKQAVQIELMTQQIQKLQEQIKKKDSEKDNKE